MTLDLDLLAALAVIVFASFLHYCEGRKEKRTLARREAAIKRLLNGGVWK